MRKLFFTLLFVCAAVLGFAQINPQAPLELDKNVKTGKLDNGLTYYVMHNEKPAQRADFYIVTNVGAVQETPDQDGLAHFLEHMCFNGTKHFPGKGIISYMESIGCAFGANINAGTGFEQTMYMLNNVPVTREGIIDSSLLILFDWSAFVTNDPAEIDAERGVILEEKRTRDGASWQQTLAMRKALFKGSALENVSLIGSEENLKNFKPESLVNYYKTWYRPDMQSIVVVGDVDADAVVTKIKDLFGQLPKAGNPKTKEPVVVPDNATPIVSIFTHKENQGTSVLFAVKSPAIPKQFRGLGVAMLNDLVEWLMSSMINERLQDISRMPDAPFLHASASFGDVSYDLHAFMGSVATKDGEALKGFNGLMTELERVKRYGFTPDEFERAKTKILKSYETAKNNAASRQNPQLVQNLMGHFLTGTPYLDPEYEYNTAKQFLDMIPLEMLNMAAKQFYGDNNQVIFYSAPEKEGLSVPTEAELVEVLAQTKAAQIEAPKVEVSNEPLMDPAIIAGSPVMREEQGKFGTTVWTLKNGIQVIVKPTDYKKDEVMVKTVAKGGRSILADDIVPSFEGNIFSTYISTT
ncbi:MAG: insulinase family protein, partial [Bacteroidales bacterium]|nr:insulinase family protein [Bacteroidales bacterium]